MRLNEFVILYLASAAPFGVADYFRQSARIARPRALLNAAGSGLLWPFALLLRKSPGYARRIEAAQNVSPFCEQRIDDARRALLSALYRTEDCAREVFGSEDESVRQAVRKTIAGAERYLGLSLAVAEIKDDALPTPRSMELCRLAGRRGEDILIAGRCLQRRHVARLRAHQAASRRELLCALAEMREEFAKAQQAQAIDSVAARSLLDAQISVYTRAIDLLSLLEDELAAMSIARILDAACAPPDDVQIRCSPAALKPVAQTETLTASVGEHSCTTSTPRPKSQLRTPDQQTIRTHG